MSGPDRSWTIAPALLWFVACLAGALWALDGGVQALADRLTVRREAGPADPAAAPPVPGLGPLVAAKPAEVADVGGGGGGDVRPAGEGSAAPALPAADPASRARVSALEDVCIDGTPERCKRWGMDGFYRGIAASKAGALGRALRLSWYGDSVVAADVLPNRLRRLMQAEFGDGGPGLVQVVAPHRFCHHEGIARASRGGWTAHAMSTTPVGDGLYGVAGSTAETDGGRATIKLVAGTVSQVELYYLAQPRGGSATVTADGTPITTVETRRDAKQPGHATASVAGGARTFELTTSGRVRVFGIGLENPRGAVVDNFGMVSASVLSFAANRPDHFAAELGHRRADLVMIMIGANEATWLGTSEREAQHYAETYGKLLATVRSARADASCLVISPTDQAEAKDSGYRSKPVMPALVAAQRSAAHGQGCAFFATYDWMGGKGSAVSWYRKGLVGSDLVHLTPRGASKLSEALYAALMAGYQRYAAP